MGEYRYQLHTHTSPCSKCGAMNNLEFCKALKEYGFAGAVLTNHFIHGNTGFDRDLPWDEFVAGYERDFIECKEVAKEFDLDIFFGIEEVVAPGRELLCYGLTPEALYNNPQLRDCSIEEWVKIMHANNVVLIQSHPFREAPYIPVPGTLPLVLMDGVEAYNLKNPEPRMNDDAINFANAYPHLIQVSGGDAHAATQLPFGGIVTTTRIRTNEELVQTLRSGNFTMVTT